MESENAGCLPPRAVVSRGEEGKGGSPGLVCPWDPPWTVGSAERAKSQARYNPGQEGAFRGGGLASSTTVQRLACEVWAEGRSKGQRRWGQEGFLPQGPDTEYLLLTVPAAERFLRPGTAHHHRLEHTVTGSLTTPEREDILSPKYN